MVDAKIFRVSGGLRLVVDVALATAFAVAAVLILGPGLSSSFVGAGIGMLAAETGLHIFSCRCASRAYTASSLDKKAKERSSANSALAGS